ncbi:hypothetical protein BDF19DRAFT_467543 [Syncephalis fuscata]|nr:hypothetical protein BDF19DRAFT_467543 [Syncephalis fuscata]
MSDYSGEYRRTPDPEDGAIQMTGFTVDLTSSSTHSKHGSSANDSGFGYSKNDYGAPLASAINGGFGKRPSNWIEEDESGSLLQRKERSRYIDPHSSNSHDENSAITSTQLEHAIIVQLIYNTLLADYVKKGDPADTDRLIEDMSKARLLNFMHKLGERVRYTLGQLRITRRVSGKEQDSIINSLKYKMKASKNFFTVMEDVIEKFKTSDPRFATVLESAYPKAHQLVKDPSYQRYWENNQYSSSRNTESTRDTSRNGRDSSSHSRYSDADPYSSNKNDSRSISHSRSRSRQRNGNSSSNNHHDNAPSSGSADTNSNWDKPQKDTSSNWDKPQKDTGSNWDKPQKDNNSNWDKPQKNTSSNWDKPQKNTSSNWDKPQKDTSSNWDKPDVIMSNSNGYSRQRSSSPPRSSSLSKPKSSITSISVLGAANAEKARERMITPIIQSDITTTTVMASSAISVSSSPSTPPAQSDYHHSSLGEQQRHLI